MKRFQLERVSRILLAPDTKQIWESQAVFNPGTLREGGSSICFTVVCVMRIIQVSVTLKWTAMGTLSTGSPDPVIAPEWEIEKQGM